MSTSLYLTVYVLTASVAMIAVAIVGLNRALAAAAWRDPERRTAVAVTAVTLASWFGAALLLSWTDAFRGAPDRVPTIQFGILAPILIGILFYWRSAIVRRAIDAIPQGWLVGFQLYRVLGLIFLVLLGAGLLPAAFAVPAGGGDVLVGLAAPLIAAIYASGTARRGAWVRGWNLFGLADLAVAVTTGFLTSVSPLQMLSFDAPNTLMDVFPLALIPVFAVPLSVLLHLASLAKLKQTTVATSPQIATTEGAAAH